VVQFVAVCYSVLQCAAVSCDVYVSVLQWDPVPPYNPLLHYVAGCCSVLQCVAVCCSVLQCVVVGCRALQCVAVCISVLQWGPQPSLNPLLQCVAVCCSVL